MQDKCKELSQTSVSAEYERKRILGEEVDIETSSYFLR